MLWSAAVSIFDMAHTPHKAHGDDDEHEAMNSPELIRPINTIEVRLVLCSGKT